jgi:small-conductance mechanosensitive channel
MMRELSFFLSVCFFVYSLLILYLHYDDIKKRKELKNYNGYISVFCVLYVIIMFKLVIYKPQNTDEAYGILFIFLFLFFLILFVSLTSFITRTKILNWIYGILHIPMLYYVFAALVDSIVKNEFGMKASLNFFLIMLFFVVPVLISYAINFIFKKKKNKEISVWALAFNIEMIMLFVLSWFY